MHTIEINTTQNVKIEYELAGIGQRVFAYLIDLFILLLVFFIVAVQLEDSPNEPGFLFYIFLFFWFGFYTLASELIGNGQSIGKLAMGIKVIKLNGEEPEFYDYFSRWSMRLLDIYFSVGAIAILLIASNKRGQRLGDIIAGTSIIRKKSSYGFTLNNILKLNLKNKDDYEFTYPLVKNLEEKDVILIKNLLYRRRLYNNRAHEEAMDLLVEKLAQLLELEKIPEKPERFLNQIISEYIILTR